MAPAMPMAVAATGFCPCTQPAAFPSSRHTGNQCSFSNSCNGTSAITIVATGGTGAVGGIRLSSFTF